MGGERVTTMYAHTQTHHTHTHDTHTHTHTHTHTTHTHTHGYPHQLYPVSFGCLVAGHIVHRDAQDTLDLFSNPCLQNMLYLHMLHMYVCVRVHACACVRACVRVCVCVCVCVCVHDPTSCSEALTLAQLASCASMRPSRVSYSTLFLGLLAYGSAYTHRHTCTHTQQTDTKCGVDKRHSRHTTITT